jgi:hypothetical protein
VEGNVSFEVRGDPIKRKKGGGHRHHPPLPPPSTPRRPSRLSPIQLLACLLLAGLLHACCMLAAWLRGCVAAAPRSTWCSSWVRPESEVRRRSARGTKGATAASLAGEPGRGLSALVPLHEKGERAGSADRGGGLCWPRRLPAAGFCISTVI